MRCLSYSYHDITALYGLGNLPKKMSINSGNIDVILDTGGLMVPRCAHGKLSRSYYPKISLCMKNIMCFRDNRDILEMLSHFGKRKHSCCGGFLFCSGFCLFVFGMLWGYFVCFVNSYHRFCFNLYSYNCQLVCSFVLRLILQSSNYNDIS